MGPPSLFGLAGLIMIPVQQVQVAGGVWCADSTARLAIPQEKNLTNEEARPWRAALFKVMLPEIVLKLQV